VTKIRFLLGRAPAVLYNLAVPNHFKKHFTLEEAVALLPTLAAIFEEIQTVKEELDARRSELSEVLDSAKTNGGGSKADYHFVQNQKIHRLLERVEKMGVLLKDLDRGLVDFPHLRGSREVFLCWMVGEKKIDYWHDIDSGFSGRQPL
jgi:hypothetical protein